MISQLNGGMKETNTNSEANKIGKNSYIAKDLAAYRSYALISEKIASGYEALCVTRANPKDIKKQYNLNVSFVWLTDRADQNKDVFATSDIKVLRAKIKEFIRKNKKSAIFLDRLDYLINMHGFGEVLKLVYSINDEIMTSDALLVLNVNPITLSQQELGLLEQELQELPKPKPEIELEVADDLYEIISFINYSERKVSFKDISKKFTITKTTARKRLNKLVEKGLLVIKKNGRNKILSITDLGKSLL